MTDITTTAPTTTTTEESSTNVPHIDDSNVVPFTPPPYIPSRIIPPKTPHFRGDLNAEAESIEKNTAWFAEHGGDTSKLETYSGLTMDVPENAPPYDLVTAEDENKRNTNK